MLYLGLDVPTVVAEFGRLAAKQGRTPRDFLPRELFTYDVRLQNVLDLRVGDNARAVGLSPGRLMADDLSACQQAGAAAHEVGFEGILAPSAAGAGDVLAVFLERTLPDSIVRDIARERWDEVPDGP